MKRRFTFLKLHPRLAILVILLLAGAGITVAQITGSRQPPSSFLPEGALVYVEAQDLEGLLQWWKDSQVKLHWEGSQNYKQFRNSRLYLKLRDRMTKWGSGGSFSFTLDNLIQASGEHSGLALYDIGELKAVAATRLPFTEAKTTEIWLAKSKFEEKKSGNRVYYAEPRQGTLSFAYAEPYLIISTDESLLVKTLSNLDAPARTLEQSAKWQSFQKQDADPDVSLFLDQEALQQNRYFQKYWIHRNVKDFAGIGAIWIDLSIEQDAIVERRYFATNAARPSGADVSSAEFFKQFQHDALYMDTPITAAKAAEQIMKLVNSLPAKDKKVSFPPTFSGASERATQAETKNILLEQIDEPVLQVKAETMLQASQEESLAKLLEAAEPQGQIRLTYAVWDNQDLFVKFPETLLLYLSNHAALNQKALLDQVLEHFLLLHSTQEEGGRWHVEPNQVYVLQSFRPRYLKFQNPWILISTEKNDFDQIANKLPEIFSPVRYSEVNWKAGRWKYTRLMQRLDHGEYQDDLPLLFSENIAGLLSVLDPIVASSVTQTPVGEEVRYELR
jgi:hypothetical protein